MHIPAFGNIIDNHAKKLVFGPPTQALLPVKYQDIYDAYKNGIQNNWTPEEIGLGEDKLEYPENIMRTLCSEL